MGELNNTAAQRDAKVSAAETIILPPPSRYEVARVGGPNDILSRLNDAVATDLANNAGRVSGDVAWAFQWNMTIGPDATFLIAKDKTIYLTPDNTPEPTSLSVLAMVGLGLTARRRGGQSG